MMLAAVNVGDLAEVIWVSLVAGVGVTLTFSLVVLGSGRSAEARRTGRDVAAIGYATLAGLALLVFLAGLVAGVNIMLSK
jgi:hypothetical protein